MPAVNPSRLLGAFAMAATLWSMGCASGGRAVEPPPALEFRLVWSGRADLDLHVRTPLGREVWYVDPRSISGGRLSEDCNVTPGDECPEPVESIAWPQGTAPTGVYEYWVRLMHPRETALPVTFTVAVIQDGGTVRSHRSELSAPGASSDRWTWTYERP